MFSDSSKTANSVPGLGLDDHITRPVSGKRVWDKLPEDDPLERLSAYDWQTLHILTDRIDSDPDAIGVWVTPERGEDGITHVGYVRCGEVVTDFFEFVDAHELLVRFDWPGWRGKDADARGDFDVISAATPMDALKYLTVMVRADRFSEGVLMTSFECGLVSAALHRVLTHPTDWLSHNPLPTTSLCRSHALT